MSPFCAWAGSCRAVAGHLHAAAVHRGGERLEGGVGAVERGRALVGEAAPTLGFGSQQRDLGGRDRFGELGAQPAEPVGAHQLEHGRARSGSLRFGSARSARIRGAVVRRVQQRRREAGVFEVADRDLPDPFGLSRAGPELVRVRERVGVQLPADRPRADSARGCGLTDREVLSGGVIDSGHNVSFPSLSLTLRGRYSAGIVFLPELDRPISGRRDRYERRTRRQGDPAAVRAHGVGEHIHAVPSANVSIVNVDFPG